MTAPAGGTDKGAKCATQHEEGANAGWVRFTHGRRRTTSHFVLVSETPSTAAALSAYTSSSSNGTDRSPSSPDVHLSELQPPYACRRRTAARTVCAAQCIGRQIRQRKGAETQNSGHGKDACPPFRFKRCSILRSEPKVRPCRVGEEEPRESEDDGDRLAAHVGTRPSRPARNDRKTSRFARRGRSNEGRAATSRERERKRRSAFEYTCCAGWRAPGSRFSTPASKSCVAAIERRSQGRDAAGADQKAVLMTALTSASVPTSIWPSQNGCVRQELMAAGDRKRRIWVPRASLGDEAYSTANVDTWRAPSQDRRRPEQRVQKAQNVVDDFTQKCGQMHQYACCSPSSKQQRTQPLRRTPAPATCKSPPLYSSISSLHDAAHSTRHAHPPPSPSGPGPGPGPPPPPAYPAMPSSMSMSSPRRGAAAVSALALDGQRRSIRGTRRLGRTKEGANGAEEGCRNGEDMRGRKTQRSQTPTLVVRYAPSFSVELRERRSRRYRRHRTSMSLCSAQPRIAGHTMKIEVSSSKRSAEAGGHVSTSASMDADEGEWRRRRRLRHRRLVMTRSTRRFLCARPSSRRSSARAIGREYDAVRRVLLLM
ncbi:hypothetical protein C8R47DRAFT_1063276 [Mycena vitilis]|nr:hypothetical protein C8R47DRAFT_1063276 [Mycena vitilis]